MAVNRFSTSWPSPLEVGAVLPVGTGAGAGVGVVVGGVLAVGAVTGPEPLRSSNVLSAVCAPAMSLLESALVTLERNCPNRVFEVALDGTKASIRFNELCAADVFPDWIAEARL